VQNKELLVEGTKDEKPARKASIAAFPKTLLLLFPLFVGSLLANYAQARIYTINTPAQWSKWTFPRGVVKITENGRVEVVKIRRNINAAANAREFVHLTAKGDSVRGGIREAGSNPSDAEKVLDENPHTWWKPSPKDDVKDWKLKVDLGRLVSATKIRLLFPDTVDARPFEQFSVYVSPGIRTVAGTDMVKFERIGRTTKPNTSTVVEYELRYESADTTRTGERVGYSLDCFPVQYVKFVANSKTKDAALAEVQVWALGDNIALGTLQRGGNLLSGKGISTSAVFDGDMSTTYDLKILDEDEWEIGGAYFTWDLGALFWIDRIQVLCKKPGFGGFPMGRFETAPQGYIIRVSDGALTPEGKIDYQTLVDVNNKIHATFRYGLEPCRHFFSHIFPPQPIQYIFFRHAHGSGNLRSRGGSGSSFISEIQLYGQGYPVAVVLESDVIELGKLSGDERAKNVTNISWTGQSPPGTKIEIRTRSGDSLRKETHYYDSSGNEISKQKWERLKRFHMQGPKKTSYKPGTDWSGWSRVYQSSGQNFLSPSPRRYMKLQAKLSSDHPEVAPSLSSISIHYCDPLVKSVRGEIKPRVVSADRDTVFRYLIVPTYSQGDIGFDQIFIKTFSPVDSATVRLRINGKPEEPHFVNVVGDSLLLGLPYLISWQKLEIRFRSRLTRNGCVLEAFIGNQSKPTFWQRVDPVERGATTVYLPSVPGSKNLIRNLTVQPRKVTPNGDGQNEEAIIRFSVLKVEKAPKVIIYNLLGELVKELRPERVNIEAQPSWEARWNGRDASGGLVLPGCYVCRVKIDAQAGHSAANRIISVVY